MTPRFQKFALALLGLLMLSGWAMSLQTPQANAQNETFTDAQKQELGAVIKDYLMQNPEVILEAVDSYQRQEQERQLQSATQKLGELLPQMTKADAPSTGNPEAQVTVIEFFDYNCGYCKRAIPDIQGILKEDQDVRFVFREMPILGPSSLTASQWALAAHKQGRYFDYHVALMNFQGEKTEQELTRIAENLGLDIEQMKRDAASPEVQAQIAQDRSFADQLGIQGTPAFIVGDELYRGYIGQDGMSQSIAKERKG